MDKPAGRIHKGPPRSVFCPPRFGGTPVWTTHGPPEDRGRTLDVVRHVGAAVESRLSVGSITDPRTLVCRLP